MLAKDLPIKHYIDHLKELASKLDDRDLQIHKLNEELSHRLLVLTQPPGGADTLKLIDVMDIELLQTLQDGFSHSYGIASVIYNEHGVPITKPSNFSDLCKLIRTSELGLKRCEESKVCHYAMTVKAGGAVLDECKNFENLLDGSVPLFIEGRRVGTWCAGQKAVAPFKEEQLRKYAKEVGVSPDELVATSKRITVGTVEEFQRVIDFLDGMCKTLGLMGLQNIQQAREIARREEVEKELRDHIAMVKAICDSLPLFIWARDVNERFLFINKACSEQMLGADPSEAIGKTVSYFADKSRAFYPGDDSRYTFDELAKESDQYVLTNKEEFHGTEEGYVDGKLVKLDVHKIPFLMNGGDFVGIVGYGKDVTGKKRRCDD